MASYKDMLDSAFTSYYDRFRDLRALSKENAVTSRGIIHQYVRHRANQLTILNDGTAAHE